MEEEETNNNGRERYWKTCLFDFHVRVVFAVVCLFGSSVDRALRRLFREAAMMT